ncbi:Neurexin-1-alpha [Atta colombica]|uniref:Neurexin-1-alpha n=1 Tax=Atta colombica TaxID=520822 RepID=A0A195BX09_9HYME|nr:Neurexin-1-alpha [Atta colombica]
MDRFHLLQEDLFAFEILGGYLYTHADLGSGSVKVKSSKTRVDDGTWHDVVLRRVEREIRVTVDSNIVEFRTPVAVFQKELSHHIHKVSNPVWQISVLERVTLNYEWLGSLSSPFTSVDRGVLLRLAELHGRLIHRQNSPLNHTNVA